MAVIGWVDPEADLDGWVDAPVDEADLARYLGAAYEQCLDFLPHEDDESGESVPVVPDDVPDSYVLAQIMQARALYRAVLSGSGDGIGADGLSVTVFPMDWTVKNLLRPRRVGRVL